MIFENISPFVRFTTKQKLYSKKNLVNYDHRFYYCLSGQGEVKLNGKVYLMQPNSFLLWRAGTLYSYEKSPEVAEFEVISCNFDYTRFAEDKQTPIPPCQNKYFSSEKIISKNEFFTDFKQFNDVIFINNAIILKDLLLSLSKEYGLNNKFRRITLNHTLTEILFTVATLIDTETNNSQSVIVKNVLNYLETHYLTDTPSLSELGKIFMYHPNHLNQLVHETSGLSIHQHLIKLKMNKAMKYLMSTDLSVSQVAEKIGISDSRYFSRIFKKTFGILPSSFRKNG